MWGIKKMEEIRTLKETGKNKFELRIKDEKNDLLTVKGYKRDEIRDIYRELKHRRDSTGLQKHQLEKDIKKLDVDDTPDIREFLEKLVVAGKLQQKDKLEEQIGLVKKELNLLKTQLLEISSAVPEVLRDK